MSVVDLIPNQMISFCNESLHHALQNDDYTRASSEKIRNKFVIPFSIAHDVHTFSQNIFNHCIALGSINFE